MPCARPSSVRRCRVGTRATARRSGPATTQSMRNRSQSIWHQTARHGAAVITLSIGSEARWTPGRESSGSTTDTPENRFVNAIVGQSRTIIGRMRAAVGARWRDAFRRSLLRDCNQMEASLMPIARHSMWEEVGRMVRIPFATTVLQRRRGYRRVSSISPGLGWPR